MRILVIAMLHRINVRESRSRWQWGCPAEGHRNWRVTDGLFECRQCERTFEALVDLETGEEIPRERIELVGAHADHKGEFGQPRVSK